MASSWGRKKEPKGRVGRLRFGADGREADGLARIPRRKLLIGIVMGAGFLLVLEALFPRAFPEGDIQLQAGMVAREDIVAPFGFMVQKSAEALEEERASAEENVIPILRLDESVQTRERKRFGDFLGRVYEIRGGEEPRAQKLEMVGQLGVALSDSTREALADPERATAIEEMAREVLFGLYGRGIIPAQGDLDLSPDATVMFLDKDTERIVRVMEFTRESDLETVILEQAGETFPGPAAASAVVEIVRPFLTPNVKLDAALTRSRKAQARAQVSELTGLDFKEDEIIIERGERVTQEHMTVLRSMALRRAELVKEEAGLTRFFPVVGRVLLAALLLGVFVLYLSVRRREILSNTRSQVLFMVLVIIVMAGAAVVHRVPGASQYLVPVVLLSMLAAMLFDFELAVVSTFLTTLLVATYTWFGLPFMLVSFVAGAVAAFSFRRVRHREDFYLSGMKVVLAYAVSIAICDIALVDFGLQTLARSGWGGVNALACMGVTIVALPLFERGFRVTTDMTLLELGDLNKPLLRNMAMTAPGTYHHSIVVGNLAEAAAEAIGADGLLARVGSYYHDIGKLGSPGYFVENQQGLEAVKSKHAGLRPKVSSLVIAAHVKDGEELAKKEGLPAPIMDIIRQHHGTSVMQYFYSKALEEAEDPDEVSSSDYSYPGPLPRSRESAIIMLADVVEARMRSIPEQLNPKRIETEINELIEKRWHEHQLDDSELTLRDLGKIRQAFLRVLVGMYHQRVRYPDQDQEEAGLGEPEGTTDAPTARETRGSGDKTEKRGAGKTG